MKKEEETQTHRDLRRTAVRLGEVFGWLLGSSAMTFRPVTCVDGALVVVVKFVHLGVGNSGER
jgi:hypothetical protein